VGFDRLVQEHHELRHRVFAGLRDMRDGGLVLVRSTAISLGHQVLIPSITPRSRRAGFGAADDGDECVDVV
jgi:hypothetical protein